MNKTELIAALADRTGVQKRDAEKSINAFVDIVTESLVNGDKVQLVGFGSFEIKERAARTARNPRTGEELAVPASKAPVFKPGKALKEAVKN
ncbi:MAG: HU family DNA-binding protein [Clostridia bacterium]|nr:HU family DNA-binding protein [Clostridia bacterium]MBR1685748.1 HU family DNA-binding protein [Clostridia bacterium]MBR2287887.1 HU family DNA-binding protein [Clostridia bacterium]